CEIGRINEFDKLYFAVLINLAGTILKIVPMKDMGWKNDGQGNRPKEFDEWVKELAEGLLELITALIAAIGDFIAGLVEAAVEAGLKFVQAIVAAVMAAIEAIVKAALLAFIYLEFALFVAGMALYFLTLLTSLYFVTLAYGGSLSLSGLSIEYTYKGRSYLAQLDAYWEYNTYLDASVPISVFSIFANDVLLLKVQTGLATSFEESYMISFKPNVVEDSQESTSNKVIKESLQTFQNSKLITGNSEDKDNDGLPDWWEKDNSEEFKDLFGSNGLTTDTKNLIVEVDYIAGFRPANKDDEFWGFIGIFILGGIAGGMAGMTLYFIREGSYDSAKVTGIVALAIGGLTALWHYVRPFDTFKYITEYWKQKDNFDLHLLYDPEDSKITLEEIKEISGLENFNPRWAWDEDLRKIEDNFHDDPKQKLNGKNLGVYIIFIGWHAPDEILDIFAGGKTDITDTDYDKSYGASIHTFWEGLATSLHVKALGNELGHILHLDEYLPLTPDSLNRYMSWVYPCNTPYNLYYTEDEWDTIETQMINRYSADEL
ncbi:MAG: hypothetical protein ACTSQJ_18800, partial [Promethearchaeota archaeon]